METPNLILNHSEIEKKIQRLSYQVYEQFLNEKELVIAGINGNGYFLAGKIAEKVAAEAPFKVHLACITLDKQNPKAGATSIDLPLEIVKGKPALIVDDVLNTGKTMVYAVSAFIREGSPLIRTLVLADRNHKAFPIAADYVGISLATTLQEHLNFDVNDQGMQLILE